MPTNDEETTTAGARTQTEIPESESKILAAFDEYEAANAALAEVYKTKPTPTPVPVPTSIEEFNKIRTANRDADAYYNTELALASNRARKADGELWKLLPARVWIHLPSRGISIGYETGTWGGYCKTLRIAKDGEPLPELPHVTYYP